MHATLTGDEGPELHKDCEDREEELHKRIEQLKVKTSNELFRLLVVFSIIVNSVQVVWNFVSLSQLPLSSIKFSFVSFFRLNMKSGYQT